MGVRSGKNDMKIIEDFGVQADIVVRPNTADLLPNSTTYSQYERIATELNRVAVLTGKNGLYFRIKRIDLFSTFELNEKIVFELETQGMKKIVAFDENNSPVATLELEVSEVSQKQTRIFSFDYSSGTARVAKFNIKAYDTNLNEQFSTYRYVQLVPNAKDHLVISENATTVNFENAKYLGIFNSIQTKSKNGWNLVNNTAVLGDGKQYSQNTDSRLSFFVNASFKFNVTIAASFQTEQDYDFLKIGYTIGTNTTQLLKSKNSANGREQDGISGTGSINQSFEIRETGSVEVFVQFVSDISFNDVGASITSVQFSQ
jgi:hypothetical protein